MDKKYPLLRIFFYLFMLTGCFLSSASMGRSMSDFNVPEQFIADNESQEDNVSESESLHELNNILKEIDETEKHLMRKSKKNEVNQSMIKTVFLKSSLFR